MSGPVPKTIIRPLKLDDRQRHDELLYELDRAHHAALPNIIRAPADAVVSEDEYRQRIADPATFIAGADTRRGLIGFIRVMVIDSPGGRAHIPIRFARIEEIVVESHERRGGVGRALLSAAINWAQTNGAQSLELGIYAFNAEAMAFYKRVGFSTKIVSLSMSLKETS